MRLQNEILQKALSIKEELTQWRRHIHQYPELGFEEHETAQFIEEKLHSWGLETQRLAQTGIMTTIPGNSNSAVGIRADIDALPVQEVAGREYGSQNAGKMHACGHDAHIAILLGFAKLWSELPLDQRPCTVRLFFQPAEEGPGGAQPMIEAGALNGLDFNSIIALHVDASKEAGNVEVKNGPLFASADWFEIAIKGHGGHGAYPHKAIDPIPVAAELILTLQRLITRETDPLQPVVLSFGAIHAGTAPNVLPSEVTLKGTLRTLDEDVRAYFHQRLAEIIQEQSKLHRCKSDFKLHRGYDVGINHPEITEKLAIAAEKIVGKEKIIWGPEPQMGGEDFYYFGKTGIPVSMFFLGAQPAEGPKAHHAPDFDIDENVLPIGVAIFYQYIIDLFS